MKSGASATGLNKDVKNLAMGTSVNAGDKVRLKGEVKNMGDKPVYRVRGVLDSDNGRFDENELVFGKIEPGETRAFEVSVRIPRQSSTRKDLISMTVTAEQNVEVEPAELELSILGRKRPMFSYAYHIVDDVKGNQDGLVQRGEKVRMLVTVKNIGQGPSETTQAILRNGPGQEGIYISAGRFEDDDPLKPGDTKTFAFTYEVKDAYEKDSYTMNLAVNDYILGEGVRDKLSLAISEAPVDVTSAKGAVDIVGDNTSVYESPDVSGRIVARVPKGVRFALTGKSEGFARVKLPDGQVGFLPTAAVKETAAPVGETGKTDDDMLAYDWQVTPPVLTVQGPNVTTSKTVKIQVEAVDDHRVRDMFVRVFNPEAKLPSKKVFYRLNRGADSKRLSAEAEVPLWPGTNYISVVARETNEVYSIRSHVVRRDTDDRVAKKAN